MPINLKVNLDDKEAQEKLKKLQDGKYKVDFDVNTDDAKQTTKDLNKMGTSVKNTNTVFGKLKSTIHDTFSSGKLAMTGYLAVLNEIRKASKNASQVIEDVDKAVTDLSIASGKSRDATSEIVKDYNKYAQDLKATTIEVTSAADDYLRAGKSMSEAKDLIKDSVMLSKLGQIDSAEATEDLLATMNGYSMSVEEVGKALDAMVAVDMAAASSSGDISTALKYCASSADVAGVSFNKLVGILSEVQDKTQLSPETIGTFANTLLSRYKDVKIGNYLSDDGEDISDYESVLKSIGIELRNSTGDFRNYEDVLQDMADKWDSLSSVQQAALAKTASGTRQQNRFYALMEGYDKVLELTEVAANSAGTALDKYNNSYANSLEAKQAALQASFESMIINSDFNEVYAGILNATTALVEFIDKTNALKGALTGLVIASGIKGFLALKTGINQAYISLNQFQNALNTAKKTNISNDEFNNLLILSQNLSKSQLELILSSKNLTNAQREQILVNSGLSVEETKLKLQTMGLASADTGLTAATTSLKNATAGLWSMLSANPLTLITTAISAGVMAYSAYSNKIEEAKENARKHSEELTDAWEEQNNSIQDTITKYKELQDKLQDSSLSAEEVTSVKKELLSVQESLNEKYGSEATQLDLVNGKYDEQISKLNMLSKKKAQDYVAENYNDIQKDKNYIEEKIVLDKSLNFKGSQAYPDDFSNAGFDLKKYLDKYDKLSAKVTNPDSQYGMTGTVNLVTSGTRQEIYDQLSSLFADLSEDFGSSNESVTKFKETISDIINDSFDSEELESAKNRIKSYVEAEILSNDEASTSYNNLVDAVNNYNTALSSGNGVDDAKKKLVEAKKAAEESTNEISNSGKVLKDVYNSLSGEAPIEFQIEIGKDVDENLQKSYDDTINRFKSSEESNLDELTQKYDEAIAKRKELYSGTDYVGNVDINNRPVVINDDGSYSTTSTSFQEKWVGDEENGHYIIAHFTPILPDGTVLDDDSLNEYIDKILNSTDPMEADKVENGGKGIVYKVDTQINGKDITDDNLEDAFGVADAWDVDMHNLQDKMYKDEAAIKAQIAKFDDGVNGSQKIKDFFDTEGINTQEEIDAFNEVTKGINDADLAIQKWNEHKKEGNETPISLSDIFFSKDFTQYRKELTELENAGKLDESVLSSNEQYKKLIDETGLSAQDALKSIQAYIKELDGWSDGIDSIQSAYDTVTSAIEEYNKNGYFTLDTIQSLLSLDDAYLSMLFDENGNLVANEEAYKALANARLDDAEAEAVRQAMSDLQSITNEATALQYLEQEHYNTADSLYNLAGAYNEVAVAAQNALNKQGITTAETDAINGIMKTLDAKKSIIQQARDDVGKNSFKKVGGSDSSSKYSKSSKDKQASEMDFFKVRLEEIDNLISDVEAHMDNLTGASAKNISIDSLIDLNTQKQSNLKKGIEMYEEYTDILLNRIPSQYREAAKNGAIKLDSISDSNVKEAIDNYRTAASSLSDYTEQLEKLNGTLKQLQLDKFNNIADDFENQIGIIEDSVDKLQKIQDITSAKTKSESVDLYNQMSDETNKQLEYLQHEKDLLINQMNEAKSNGIDVASEEWFEMETTLEDVNDSILDCTSSLLDFSDAIKQIYIDNFDNVVSVFDEMNDKISSNIDTLQNLSDLQESRNKSTSRVYYDKMISQTELQIEKLYEERQKLQSALNEAVLNGVQVGDSDYADMVSQIESVTSSIVESKKSIEDYKQSIKDLYVTYFNNVSDNFSNQFDAIENANNILSSIADLADSQGSVAKTVYEQLMNNTTKQIDILNNKKKELADSLNDAVANGIEVGTDEWYEMYSAISECDNEILSAKKELVDFQDTLNELKWEQFNKVTDTFSHVGNQIQTVLQVIADEAKDIFSDENFDINNFLKNKGDFSELFTDEGKTTLGLYAQQYEMAVMENERYQKAVKELDKAYKDGEYTYEKYLEKLYELTEAQNEQSETIYSTKKAIQDLVKTALNAQVDAYSKLIDKQKESLSKEKEIYEHKKNLAQKEKEIAEIEAEIAARSGDDSSENQAEITQLQQELADKKSDMDDYLYDHSVSSQEEALDESVTSAESRIKEYLSNTEKLLADTLEFTKTSANDIYNTITELANDYGISIDKSVINSWKNSENAIASYGQQVNTSTSGFMNNLQIVENGIIREQEQTRIFTNELMTAFAVDPSQLNTNLDYIYGQIVNDKNGAYNFALQLMDTYATPDDVLIQNLNDISASLNNRVNDANTFGSSLSSAYNVDPQSLYNNLNGIAVGLDKDRSYSEMFKNSLASTFNADSYNIGGLINAINSVGDAAASMGAKISGATNDSLDNMALINKSLDSVRQATEGTLNIINQNMSAENALKDKLGLGNYKLVSESGKVIDLGYTKNSDALTQLEGHNNEVYKNGSNDYYRLQTYSNGGVVKDVDNPIFDKIARQLGEDHLVAVKNNELIIPPEKITELVKQYTIPQFNYTPPSLPNISDSIKTNTVNVEVNYGGNMLNVEGSIDKSFAGELNNMANKVSDKIKKDLYKSGKLLGMHKIC